MGGGDARPLHTQSNMQGCKYNNSTRGLCGHMLGLHVFCVIISHIPVQFDQLWWQCKTSSCKQTSMWRGEKQKTRTDHPLPDCIETFLGEGGYPLNKQKFAYFLPWDHKIVFLFYCLLFKPLWWKGMTGKHQLCWKQNHVSVQDFTSLAVSNHHTEQKQTHNSLISGH